MTVETLDRPNVERLLTAPPHWMLRWGNLAFVGVLVLVLAIAALVPYPDAIQGKATIASDPQPTVAVARLGGALTLIAADGETVAAGRPLAVVETAAQLSDVRSLRAIVTSPANTSTIYPPLRVGELQPHYASFLDAVNRWRDLVDDPQATGSEMELALEIDYAERQLLADRSQVASLEAKAQLTKSFHDRTRALFAEKLVSKQDVERAESALLDARSAIESGRAAAAMSATRVTRYRQALADFRHGRALQLARQSRGAEEARQSLQAQLDQWEALHVVTAPHAGQVWFLPAAVHRQHVAAEQPLMMVLPRRWKATARIDVPLHRAAQLVVGQDVVVELVEYPKSEYGTLRGKVARVSPMARDDRYVVDADLSFDAAGKIRSLKPGTTGVARIVTRDRSILARLFERLTAAEGAR